ncbi:hypothetical protein R3P38DRAFT_3188860 [Favolaschia claudopus]|uniref:Uncharacterized protein n=1 Tax=Favolaschia claudopus TaxID=2862362 RepID=A0AAW0BTN2_9AGAR
MEFAVLTAADDHWKSVPAPAHIINRRPPTANGGHWWPPVTFLVMGVLLRPSQHVTPFRLPPPCAPPPPLPPPYTLPIPHSMTQQIPPLFHRRLSLAAAPSSSTSAPSFYAALTRCHPPLLNWSLAPPTPRPHPHTHYNFIP